MLPSGVARIFGAQVQSIVDGVILFQTKTTLLKQWSIVCINYRVNKAVYSMKLFLKGYYRASENMGPPVAKGMC